MRMNKNKAIALILENLALLAIGVILVVGFWYHSEFYSIYAPILFVGGGGIIVAMIWTIVFFRKERDFFHEVKGVLIFESREKEQIEMGQKTALIFKDHLGTYEKDQIYQAKINITSKKNFAKLVLKKIGHIELSDLGMTEIVKLGFEDLDDFKDHWKKKHGKYKLSQEATLIEFNIQGGG